MARPQGMNVPRMGIQRSLTTPGVTPQTPRQPSNLAAALMATLGQGAQTARAAAQFAAVHHEQQKMDDTQKMIAAAAKGAAIPDFATVEVHNLAWQNEAHRALDTLDVATLDRKPGEDLTGALHRWMGTKTAPGAPDIFKATLRDGTRKAGAAYTVQVTRLAQAKGYADSGEILTRAVVSGEPDLMVEAYASRQKLGNPMGQSGFQMVAPAVAGMKILANQGSVAGTKNAVAFLNKAGYSELTIGFVKEAIGNYQKDNFSAVSDNMAVGQAVGGEPTIDHEKQWAELVTAGKISPAQKGELESDLMKMRETTFKNHFFRKALDEDYTPQQAEKDIRNHVLGPKDGTGEKTGKWIAPGTGVRLLQSYGQQRATFAGIKDIESAGIGSNIVLTKAHGNPMVQTLFDRGYINMGEVTPGSSARPFQSFVPSRRGAAFAFMAEKFFVAPQVISNIRAGGASENRAVVDEAAINSVYLLKTNPKAYGEMINKADPIARARFMAIMLADSKAPFDISNQAGTEGRIAGMGDALMALKPFEPRTDAELFNITHGVLKDPAARRAEKADYTRTVRVAGETLQEMLPHEMSHEVISAFSLRGLSRLRMGLDQKRDLSNYVEPTMITDTIDYALSNTAAYIAVGVPMIEASELGNELARKQVYLENPPIVLRDEVKAVPGMPPDYGNIPELGANIHAAAMREDSVDFDTRDTHRVVWVNDENPGLGLVDNETNQTLMIMRDGQAVPFRYNPKRGATSTPDAQRTIQAAELRASTPAPPVRKDTIIADPYTRTMIENARAGSPEAQDALRDAGISWEAGK